MSTKLNQVLLNKSSVHEECFIFAIKQRTSKYSPTQSISVRIDPKDRYVDNLHTRIQYWSTIYTLCAYGILYNFSIIRATNIISLLVCNHFVWELWSYKADLIHDTVHFLALIKQSALQHLLTVLAWLLLVEAVYSPARTQNIWYHLIINCNLKSSLGLLQDVITFEIISKINTRYVMYWYIYISTQPV